MTDPNPIRSKAERLRSKAYEFCNAFVAGESPTRILDQYFTPTARILEHGPVWAQERLPFLGQTFQGRGPTLAGDRSVKHTCDQYYDLLSATLTFHPTKDTVPPKEDFLVDPEQGTVTVKLRARFASVQTGKSWEEEFVYILSEFDDDGKIGSQELWADPLSAWMAVQEG